LRSYKYPWPTTNIPPDKDWQVKRALWISELQDRFDDNYFRFIDELNRITAINPDVTLAWLDARFDWQTGTWSYPYFETGLINGR
jgi:hypothetical protein